MSAKYRCLRTVVVDDCHAGTKDEVRFVEGRDYPLEEASYARWERRGVFGAIPENKPTRGRRKKGEADAGGNSGGPALPFGDGDKEKGERAASDAPAPGAVIGAGA